METNTGKRRLRKVSSWMTDAVRAIENEEEILAVKKIVLKVLDYMEEHHMTQKELAEKLGVSPQYINKFLHGQVWDLKISTAIRYGRILNIKLLEIPESEVKEAPHPTVILTMKHQELNLMSQIPHTYKTFSRQPFRTN
ncbi:MAG: helix-turn-helix domain-containing protein [Bacteroidales bacterium]|nr:helix-turn-helix domain-containing protein [Bacteroidales bacterium]